MKCGGICFMLSSQLIRFIVGHDADDYISEEKEVKQDTPFENIMYRYSKYATIPVEIKK